MPIKRGKRKKKKNTNTDVSNEVMNCCYRECKVLMNVNEVEKGKVKKTRNLCSAMIESFVPIIAFQNKKNHRRRKDQVTILDGRD